MMTRLALLALVTACKSSSTNEEMQMPDEMMQTVPDTTAPSGGAVQVASTTTSTVVVTWPAASDAVTASDQLQYKLYYAKTPATLGSIAEIEAARLAMDWTTATSFTLASLSLKTSYVFNVLVKDPAGNVAVYTSATGTTADGTWGERAPLVSTPAGSAYYSKATVSDAGDAHVGWSDDDGARVAASAASGWSAPVAWGPTASQLGGLYSASGETLGLVVIYEGGAWGLSVAREAGTLEVVSAVTGLTGGGYRYKSNQLCPQDNGDVTLAWIDGTDSDHQGINAAYSTAGVWSAVTPVSLPSAATGIRDMDMGCVPNGDHVIAWADDANVTARRRSDSGPVLLNGGRYNLNDTSLQAGTALNGEPFVTWVEEETIASVNSLAIHSRRLRDNAWSDTVLHSIPESQSIHESQLAGPQLIWREDTKLRTSRLEGDLWSAAADLVDADYKFVTASNRDGDVLLVRYGYGNIYAQRFWGGAWEAPVTLKTGGDDVGDESLSAAIGSRGQAVVAWTEWNGVNMTPWARRFY